MSLFWAPIVASAIAAQSTSPIVTDRPDFTESAVVVPFRSTQIEMGLTHTSIRPDTVTSGPELLIRHSLGQRLEARFALGDYNVIRSAGANATGWSDSTLGVKFQFGPTANGTDIGLIVETSLSTGSDGFGSTVWEPGFKLCASRDLTSDMSLSAMIAASLTGRDRIGAWQGTLSLGKSLTENSGLFLEYATGFGPGVRPTHFAHAGYVFQPCATSQWDVHFGFDLANPRSNAFIGFGYGVRF